jgi:hypothetical protein
MLHKYTYTHTHTVQFLPVVEPLQTANGFLLCHASGLALKHHSPISFTTAVSSFSELYYCCQHLYYLEASGLALKHHSLISFTTAVSSFTTAVSIFTTLKQAGWP